MDSEPVLPPWAAEARQHLAQAYEHYEADRYPAALAECDAALGIDPDLAEAHNLRGIVLEELDRPVEAFEAYRRAAELDPALTEAGDNLAQLGHDCLEEASVLYEEDRELEAALEKCGIALMVNPDSLEAQDLRAAILERLENTRGAAAANRFAHDLDPAMAYRQVLDLGPFLWDATGGSGETEGEEAEQPAADLGQPGIEEAEQPPLNEWMAVARVNHGATAETPRNRLVLQGIPTVLLNADSDGLVLPSLQMAGGVWLLVRPDDVYAALDELGVREEWEALGAYEGEAEVADEGGSAAEDGEQATSEADADR